jgi:ribonuclease Z
MRCAAAGTVPVTIHTLLLTHLHSDHVTDFNDIVTMRWAMSPTENPLKVVGPVGTARLADLTIAMLEEDIGYRLAHHDDLNWRPSCQVQEVTDGVVFDDGAVKITAAPTDHAPVHPTVGYRVDADGHSVVLAGDTVPCAGLDEMCRDADLYVQTVIRSELVQAIPNARLQDIIDYHSSVEQAAQTAERAGVKTLVLTHYVPPMQPGDEGAWRSLAAAHFSGTIVLGDDLTVASA